MTQKITHVCQGTCSRQIDVELENGVVRSVSFTGGCHGNQQGIAALVRGMTAAEAVARLEGIDCRGRGTSCPDQLAKALKKRGFKFVGTTICYSFMQACGLVNDHITGCFCHPGGQHDSRIPD